MIPDSVKLAVIEEYKTYKISIAKLAKKHSVSERSITLWLRKYGIEIRKTNGGELDIDNDEVNRLYDSGKSTYEIAKLLDCSDETIRKRILTMRPPEVRNLHSEETKHKISESSKALWHDQNYQAKVKSGTSTDGYRKKLSDASKNRHTLQDWVKSDIGRRSISERVRKNAKEDRAFVKDTLRYSDAQINEAIEKYLEGDTSESISSKFGMSASSVLRWLKDKNIKINHQADYEGNQDFFTSLSDEKSCYWFGFLCADGSILDRYIRTLLSSKDSTHLEKFHEHIQYKKPIKTFKRIRYWKNRDPKEYEYALSLVGSAKMVSDLEHHGIELIKKGKYEPLEALNDEQFKWFLRGYFDGDGSIYKVTDKNWCWYICAQHPSLLNYFGKRMPFVKTVNIVRSGKYIGYIHRLRYTGNQIVPSICEWLYGGAGVYLGRKYELALRSINERI